jgi:hypothetical protein
MSELRLQPKEWGDALPMIEHGINNTPSAALAGLAPNEVFLGCKRTDPLDGILVPVRGDIVRVKTADYPAQLVKDLTEFMEVRRAERMQLCEMVTNEYSRRREVNDRYNKKHFRPETPMLDVGSLVLVASHQTHVPKLQSVWAGPMKVISVENPFVFKVQSLIDDRCETVHASRLRSYRNDFRHTDEGIKEQANYFKSGTYEVERIVDVRKEGQAYEVLVHWFGFESDDDTWEPAQEIWSSASSLMIEFIKQRTDKNVMKALCKHLMVDFGQI